MNLLVINGPNLNLLGLREPDIYGRENYAALLELIESTCAQRGIEVECFQSNHEGAIVDRTPSSSTRRPIPTPAWPSWTP